MCIRDRLDIEVMKKLSKIHKESSIEEYELYRMYSRGFTYATEIAIHLLMKEFGIKSKEVFEH